MVALLCVIVPRLNHVAQNRLSGVFEVRMGPKGILVESGRVGVGQQPFFNPHGVSLLLTLLETARP